MKPTSNVPLPSVALMLAGFPALYLLNSTSPWSRRFAVEHDPTYYFVFVFSLLLLHWSSAAVTFRLLYRNGLRAADVGFVVSARSGSILLVALVAIGMATAAAREIAGPAEPLWQGPAAGLHLTTAAQRGAWIVMSLSAAFCEELVYRGFGITMLRAQGFRVWSAVALSTTSWVLVHGVGGALLFVPHFVVGLLFAALFLWRGTLTLAMVVHALVDLSLLGT